MVQRDALERRIYRLALLLTGDRDGAVAVIDEVLRSRADLSALDSAHLDRLTVLRSREMRPDRRGAVGAMVQDGVAAPVAAALDALAVQQREAWALHRVYCVPIRETSRAMDCSTAAVQRHLDAAEAAMVARLGFEGAEAAALELRAYSLTLDVPPFYRRRRTLRRRRRRALVVLLAIAAAGMGAAVYRWATG